MSEKYKGVFKGRGGHNTNSTCCYLRAEGGNIPFAVVTCLCVSHSSLNCCCLLDSQVLLIDLFIKSQMLVTELWPL